MSSLIITALVFRFRVESLSFSLSLFLFVSSCMHGMCVWDCEIVQQLQIACIEFKMHTHNFSQRARCTTVLVCVCLCVWILWNFQTKYKKFNRKNSEFEARRTMKKMIDITRIELKTWIWLGCAATMILLSLPLSVSLAFTHSCSLPLRSFSPELSLDYKSCPNQ